MTVEELFTQTIGIMGLTPANATTYRDSLYAQVNTILGQLFDLENNVRVSKELEPLTEIPSVASDSDVLTYQDEVLKRVVTWGLAQLFALTDDDTIKAGFFGARFAEESYNVMKLEQTEILDVYGAY